MPDPEHAAGDEIEVEITDLDSGKIPGRYTRLNRAPSLRARAWMSIAVIAGIALLVVAVLLNVSHLPKAARVTAPPLQINYPVSLSVADGICYATAPTGVVTALRVRDGSLLWRRRAGGKTGEKSATVVDGVIYLTPLFPYSSNATTVTVEALRASDGSPLWSRTLPTDAPTSFQLTVVNKVVYVWSAAEKIDALRPNDGSLLWHYTERTPFASMPSVADGVVYVVTQDGHLSALRADNGLMLWRSALPVPPSPAPPIMADGMVYLSLQDGGMDVLSAGTGVLLWRYIPRVPALQLFSLPLVADGVVYALTQDGHLYALRASDGFTVWRVALHTTDLLPPLIETGGIIYVGALDGSVYALRESSGSVLWRHQVEDGGPASIMVAQGVVYLAFYTTGVNTIANIIALRAGDGFVLWRYTPHVSARQLSPVMRDDLVLIALDDGSIDALSASNGSLRWHRVMNS